ncbi:MAG: OmpH family outer membrane protein [Burkholderiales bacterium]|nr:OmpH family outer membrane protein [Burkholderiales bacterium]
MVLAASVSCVAADEIKIGIVNTERVMRESAPAIEAQKKIEKEFASRDLNLQKMAKQAKDLQAQLDKEGMALLETDRAAKERDLANLSRDFQRMQREFREDLNLRKNEELAAVIEKANKAIIGIAQSEKYDLILQEAVYRSPKIDITDKVIRALANEK